MLKAQNKYRKIPKNIIVNVGINDRNSKADATATNNLTTMATKIATKYPSSDIYLTQINYSDKLTTMEKTNLDAINKTMLYLETQQTQIHVIDKLNDSTFETKSKDNIHWTENTANDMIRHWLSSLN